MDRVQLRARIEKLRLKPINRRLIAYWLDLCGDGPPPEDAFNLAMAGDALAGCMIFDVLIGKSVTCRMAGSIYEVLFGRSLAGADWLAMTPAPNRRTRLIRFSAVAQGAIGIGQRKVGDNRGKSAQFEEIMLPFARSPLRSPVSVLFHSEWRPRGSEWLGMKTNSALEVADDFKLIALD